MRDSSLADAMVNEHERIDNMVEELLKGETTAEDVMWAVQGHFAMEEKATFNLKGSADPEQRAMAMRLISEHDAILLLLRDLVDLEEKWFIEVNNFKNKIKEHSEFEDEHFYPTLERSIARTKKDSMIAKIAELA